MPLRRHHPCVIVRSVFDTRPRRDAVEHGVEPHTNADEHCGNGQRIKECRQDRRNNRKQESEELLERTFKRIR